MSEEFVIELITGAMILILKISMPVLIVGLVIGLVVGIFQATTQIQEMTLSFIPKIIAIFLVIFLMGHWMMVTLTEYTIKIFESIVIVK